MDITKRYSMLEFDDIIEQEGTSFMDMATSLEPESSNEKLFKGKLLIHSDIVNLIEDRDLQQFALQCIPAQDLEIKATQALSTLEGDDHSFEDCLILELLHWFKFSFFKWMDTPKCPKCNQSTVSKGYVKPTPEETVWHAGHVENYYCNACNINTRFPRYNHPRKLLETRTGRCGEWTICFTLICRAFDLDARVVVDWTDHIWTEMYSPSKQRWVHCDPCENICDQPLLYEMGWKKKLFFIIAFSKDEVQDVTWRYTREFSEVLKRRREHQCRDSFILSCISFCTDKCRSGATPERLNFLLTRQVWELAEFLSPPNLKDVNLGGRVSGSLDWRLARGEISSENESSSYIFVLNPTEIERKYICIQYNCAQDEYIRTSDSFCKMKNWNSCTNVAKGVFRKVETDWNTAYIARVEGAPLGSITWKFDFSNSGLVLQKLKVHLLGTTFHQGKVKWSIQAIKSFGIAEAKTFFNGVLQQVFSDEDFRGSIGLLITAELSEGNGPQAWQHAQLFRQPLGTSEAPFEVEIHLENSKS